MGAGLPTERRAAVLHHEEGEGADDTAPVEPLRE